MQVVPNNLREGWSVGYPPELLRQDFAGRTTAFCLHICG